jgi:hypothetical protein
VLDWSRGNLQKLYDIGYEAGEKFQQDYARELDAGRWFDDRIYPACSEILGAEAPLCDAAVRNVEESPPDSVAYDRALSFVGKVSAEARQAADSTNAGFRGV